MEYELFKVACYMLLIGCAIFYVMHYLFGFTLSRKKIAPYSKRIFQKFEPRSSVMNLSELSLYRVLSKELDSKFLIFPMVRIEDVIVVKTTVRNLNERNALRGRIKSRHFDFVICDFNGCPLGVVELDGPTHRFKQQKAIDNFKDGLVEAAGLKMFRLLVGQNYGPAIKEFSRQLS